MDWMVFFFGVFVGGIAAFAFCAGVLWALNKMSGPRF